VIVQKAVLALAGIALGLAVAAILLLRPRGHRDRPEPPRCQEGPTLPGIDVSYYQEAIDWQRVRRAGIRFAFIRLSDGATIRDSRFATNWAEAKQAGVVRGAYQYFRPDQSVTEQADLMIAAMHNRTNDDLPPVIDLEADAGLTASVIAARARAWIDRVRARLGVEPIVYTGGELWRNGGADTLAGQALWLAHYTQGCPSVPAPWTHWTFWQHTERGAIPGIEGPVDLDLFAGTLDDLHVSRGTATR
jgi:lysozyme